MKWVEFTIQIMIKNIFIIIIGGLDTFEPWIKNIEWKGGSKNPDSRITLKCTSLEENKDHCQNSPCKNDGTCYNGPKSFYCDCKLGWTGETCIIDSK